MDKGADIFEFTYKPRDLDFMWQSPMEMRKPFVATSALPEGAFHDYYYGGWQEILPSAGWATEPYMGTFQGLHGEASLLPFESSLLWKIRLIRSPCGPVCACIDHPSRLSVRCPLRGTRPPSSSRKGWSTNPDSEFAIIWGHHPALGTAIPERKVRCPNSGQESRGSGIPPERPVGTRRRL